MNPKAKTLIKTWLKGSRNDDVLQERSAKLVRLLTSPNGSDRLERLLTVKKILPGPQTQKMTAAETAGESKPQKAYEPTAHESTKFRTPAVKTRGLSFRRSQVKMQVSEYETPTHHSDHTPYESPAHTPAPYESPTATPEPVVKRSDGSSQKGKLVTVRKGRLPSSRMKAAPLPLSDVAGKLNASYGCEEPDKATAPTPVESPIQTAQKPTESIAQPPSVSPTPAPEASPTKKPDESPTPTPAKSGSNILTIGAGCLIVGALAWYGYKNREIIREFVKKQISQMTEKSGDKKSS